MLQGLFPTSYLCQPSYFILIGAMSNYPPLLPSSVLDTFRLRGLIFWHSIFLPFHTAHGVCQARILEWIAISFSSGPHFVRILHPGWMTHPVALKGMTYNFIELCKPLHHHKAVVHEGDRKSIDNDKKILS